MQIEEQIIALRKQMTLEEKASMCHGAGLFQTAGVSRLGIPPLKMSDGPMGVRNEFPQDSWTPCGNSDDYVTYFPSNMCIASTWNEALAEEFGEALGEEARGRGKDVILAPGINIIRSPLCGRNFEYMSEDPYLISQLAVPIVRGIQKKDVAACVKHFAANNQEHNRLEVSVELDERSLQEIYLKGFKAAVCEGGSYTIMGAYNRLRGVHCCENTDLLDRILRQDWGYDGVVISDWGAVHNTLNAANVSLDIEMNVTTDFDNYCFGNPLVEAIRKGEVDEAKLDAKVDNILRLMFRLNILDGDRMPGSYNTVENRETALNIVQDGIILLKNEQGMLPLDKQKKQKICVIGENANYTQASGGGSAEIKALYEITPLMGIKKHLGGNGDVHFAAGYSSKKDLTQEKIKALAEEALELARQSDTIIFFGGLNHNIDTEGFDKEDLELPYGQDELIQKLIELNKKVIVVMVLGSPVSMEKWIHQVDSVILSFYGGMEVGTGLAEVIFGEINPSGKLPVSFGKRLEDYSAHGIGEFKGDVTVHHQDGIFIGYRYIDQNGIIPRFPFGFGLSYSTFSYEDITVKQEQDNIIASLNILNTSDRAGAQVIQLYVGPRESKVLRPKKELKKFKKVYLDGQEKKKITFTLSEEDFTYYDEEKQAFVVDRGQYDVYFATSSRDFIEIKSIQI